MKTSWRNQFFTLLQSWPRNSVEQDKVADVVRRATGAAYACVFFDQPSDETASHVGLSFDPSIDGQKINRGRFAYSVFHYISERLRNGEPSNQMQVHQFKMNGDSIFRIEGVGYLTLVRSDQSFWGIALGSTKPLTEEGEFALLALQNKLMDLKKISNLENEVKTRSQFLSIASHELKTPLTAIYGILQLKERMLRLKGDQTVLPEQERHLSFLKMVIKQVERLNELIDGLLDVSRIQNGRFMVEPTDADVAALLRECIQVRLSIIAREEGVKLNVDADQSLMARVDPVRMEEVVNNLVMNALRYSPEGGVIWIRLKGDGHSFRLTVRDQGPSLPIEDRERIFQPFERAPRTARMGGLGLGLYISRQIALLHGGNVSLVESLPGKGNVFEAYFPIRGPA